MYVNKKFAMREKHMYIKLGPDQTEGWGKPNLEQKRFLPVVGQKFEGGLRKQNTFGEVTVPFPN